MKNMIKFHQRRVVFAICFALIISGPCVNNASASKKKIAINKKTLTLYEGKSSTLKLINVPKKDKKKIKKKLKWSSTNKNIATVTSSGKVTAKKKGSAKIMAKVGKKKYTCKITVNAYGNIKPPTKTENYDTLKNYIKDKGSVDESGNLFVEYTDTNDDVDYTGRITYDESKDILVFSIIYSQGSDTVIMSSEFDLRKEDTITFDFAEMTNEENITGKVTFKGSTYKISTKYDFVPEDGRDYSAEQGKMNHILQVGFQEWNAMLQLGPQLVLSDLGFSAYY